MIESLVSVVVPCFNHADLLSRSVSSALGQRFVHEIIIVDDCSTDKSFSIAEDLCRVDGRVSVFRTFKNAGPASARNFGAQLSTGHYITFLDADDQYLDGALDSAVCAIEAAQDMKALKFWMEFVDETGSELVKDSDPRKEALVFSSPCNILMTLEAFRVMGGFPESEAFRGAFGGEDVAFNKALAQHMQPLGKLKKIGYRCISKPGDHLRRFLDNTRVVADGFEFLTLSNEQKPGGVLELAIDSYLERVGARLDEHKKRKW